MEHQSKLQTEISRAVIGQRSSMSALPNQFAHTWMYTFAGELYDQCIVEPVIKWSDIDKTPAIISNFAGPTSLYFLVFYPDRQ